MNKFKWCYIGAGTISTITAQEITKTNKHEIVSIWNRTKSKAITFSEEFGSKVYDTAEDAICDNQVMGVYIAVTADKHYEYAMIALKNKKPVLIEKPFARNSKETKELISYAKEQKTFLAEAMWTWYAPTANQVKKWIDEKTIGKIKSVHATYSVPLIHIMNADRLLDPNRCGGALMDIGVYPITYCYRLFGMPNKTECKGIMKNGVDLGEKITLSYTNFKCYLDISIDERKGENIIIFGSEAKIEVPWFHMAEQASLDDDKDVQALLLNYQNKRYLYNYQFDQVAQDILNGRTESRSVPLKATQDVMKIIDECFSQMGMRLNNK